MEGEVSARAPQPPPRSPVPTVDRPTETASGNGNSAPPPLAPLDPNLLASLLPRVDARLGLGVGEGCVRDPRERFAYATFSRLTTWHGAGEDASEEVRTGCDSGAREGKVG